MLATASLIRCSTDRRVRRSGTMRSMLLRGLTATKTASTSTSSDRKHSSPGCALSLESSPSSKRSSVAASTPPAETLPPSRTVTVEPASSDVNPVPRNQVPYAASSPVAAFKRRLARQASVLSSRNWRKKTSVASGGTKEPLEHQSKALLASHPPTGSSQRTLVPEHIGLVGTSTTKAEARSPTLSSSNFEALHLSVRRSQLQRQSLRGYLHKATSHKHTFIRMATENAQPPVSYSRLQDITTSVSLSSVHFVQWLTVAGV